MRFISGLLLITLLASCSPSNGSGLPTPTPPVTSAWGPVTLLGEAQQAQAPAFWPGAENLMAAWIGADGASLHHELRRFDRVWTDITPLTVPPVRPYAQQLFLAANGYY